MPNARWQVQAVNARALVLIVCARRSRRRSGAAFARRLAARSRRIRVADLRSRARRVARIRRVAARPQRRAALARARRPRAPARRLGGARRRLAGAACDAVLASEDRRFREHARRRLAALPRRFRQTRAGERRGGSTLTMQLAALADPELETQRPARLRRQVAPDAPGASRSSGAGPRTRSSRLAQPRAVPRRARRHRRGGARALRQARERARPRRKRAARGAGARAERRARRASRGARACCSNGWRASVPRGARSSPRAGLRRAPAARASSTALRRTSRASCLTQPGEQCAEHARCAACSASPPRRCSATCASSRPQRRGRRARRARQRERRRARVGRLERGRCRARAKSTACGAAPGGLDAEAVPLRARDRAAAAHRGLAPRRLAARGDAARRASTCRRTTTAASRARCRCAGARLVAQRAGGAHARRWSATSRSTSSCKALGLEPLTRDADHYGYSLALGGADVTLLALANAYRALANGGRVYSPRSRSRARK